jgi:tRNA(Glu) U13 pseudouridine synthase TruD
MRSEIFQAVLTEGLDIALETVEDQLPGTYRTIAVVPAVMEYRVVEGPEVAKIRIIDSDIKKFLPISEREEPCEHNFDAKPAIVLSCKLPASAYLTMAVREAALEISEHRSRPAAEAVEDEQLDE